MHHVVITQSIYDQAPQLLAEAGIPYIYRQGDTLPPAELKAHIREATAVVCLLADKLIELEVVETVSRETVRTTLKKMNLSPG